MPYYCMWDMLYSTVHCLGGTLNYKALSSNVPKLFSFLSQLESGKYEYTLFDVISKCLDCNNMDLYFLLLVLSEVFLQFMK
jgi:hypothetical protein